MSNTIEPWYPIEGMWQGYSGLTFSIADGQLWVLLHDVAITLGGQPATAEDVLKWYEGLRYHAGPSVVRPTFGEHGRLMTADFKDGDL